MYSPWNHKSWTRLSDFHFTSELVQRSIDGGLDKENVEYYMAIGRDEALIHATTWMNLEDTMLRESNQTPKATFCMILCT